MENRMYVEPCKGYEEPYLFISYARVDTQRVEAILSILYRRGFRIWYDQAGDAIRGSENWYQTIEKRVEKSSSFLAFISGATEHREVVMQEISWGIQKSKQGPDYKVVFVFLDRVSPEGFPDDIKKEMREKQFIDFRRRGGITERFINGLSSVAWPECIVDQEYRRARGLVPWSPNLEADQEIKDSILAFTDRNGVELRWDIEPVEQNLEEIDLPEGIELPEKIQPFYPFSPDQMDTNTVYPIVMDNQWIPADMYTRTEFYQEGLRGKNLAGEIIARQRREILRALLHNWQIVVNRASILNSKVFSDWYHEDNPEYLAFAQLVQEAAIVMFLFTEKRPTDLPKGFGISADDQKAWIRFCLSHEVSCLRFDWNSEESNRYETSVHLAYHFQDFCLTAAENAYCMKRLSDIFDIPAEAFISCWRKVQEDVQHFRDDRTANPAGRSYTRERFYQSFLIDPEKHSVDEGILDLNKNPFAREMKQVIDFRYSLNLPMSLGLQPLVPLDSPLSPDLFEETGAAQRSREIDADELTFAVSEFGYHFQAESMLLPKKGTDLSLQDIVLLRKKREWRDYLRAMTEGKKRSHLEQVDYFDTLKVWKCYDAFLRMAGQTLPELCWEEQKAALSVIYHFEDVTLITVYEKDRYRLLERLPLEKVKERLNRKVSLVIDFVCGDCLQTGWESVLLTQLRLFEGITHINGWVVYQKLLEKLFEKGFERDLSE